MTDNPSAFPVNTANLGEGGAFMPEPGMTLRDWFAGQTISAAMQETYGLDWGKLNKDWPARVARVSYAIADAMLAERAKGGEA